MKHLFLFAAALFIGAVSLEAQHGDGTVSVTTTSSRLYALETAVQGLSQENQLLKETVLELQTQVNSLKTQLNGMAGFTKVGNKWTLAAGTNEVVIQAGAISLNSSSVISNNSTAISLNARNTIGLYGSLITANDQPVSGEK